MPKSNDNDFNWTVGDIRILDNRLSKIESTLLDLKEQMDNKNHIVIDNSKPTDWKAIAIFVGSAIAAFAAIWSQLK